MVKEERRLYSTVFHFYLSRGKCTFVFVVGGFVLLSMYQVQGAALGQSLVSTGQGLIIPLVLPGFTMLLYCENGPHII